jgi:flagellar motor switch protein FliN/FliY
MTLNGHSTSPGKIPDTTPAATLTDSVDVPIEVFVGDTLLTIGDLNRLRSGDVVRLAATLADPVELRVNGVRIARGELVAVGDQFAVRISEIV